MSEILKVTGTILSAAPQGDSDKRIVIETCELGKITAFARGCRRPGSPLLAAADPFVTGTFSVVPGRSAYRLAEAEVREYFRELANEQPGVYTGFYFLDLVDYYGREGMDGTDMLNHLYLSLKALLNKSLGNELVRRIFELRLFSINGDYAPDPDTMDSSMLSIVQYICYAPLGKLFTFTLEDDKIIKLSRIADKARRQIMDREPRSLKIMESFQAFAEEHE
ncbi:MAG: DNA repair protein RecO [Lachnospiraceae bacterium]|nr:DNA repair protein RecO [Lachnospiraceae bacterium]MBR3526029.1 DNA repair protein RecO [Lachnospiraceae bacterium]